VKVGHPLRFCMGREILPPLPNKFMTEVKLGKYKHYKGKEYRVIGLAKHSETLEELVIYEALYDNPESKLWVRPKKMFLEEVEVDGQKIPRFEYLDE
jgi:hypothetical protein